jgi:hypothetical protein
MRKSVLAAIVAVTVGCDRGPAPATAGPVGSAGSAGAATPIQVAAAPAATPTPATPKPPAPAVGGKPLKEALAAAAGKPLLLALDAKGQLIARTVEGGYSAVVLPGPYGDALHDVAADLVWLRHDTGVDVLDLRTPGAPGTAVATPLVTSPNKALEKLGEHFDEPPHWDMTTSVVIMVGTACHGGAGIVFDWTKGGAATTTGAEQVKIVGKDWLAAQDHRSRHDLPPGFAKIGKRLKVPKGIGTCKVNAKEEYGKDACGAGLEFGATGPQIVVVSANPDKCPAKQCQLYDKATKKYALVPAFESDDTQAPSCGPFLFDPTGKVYLIEDKVCTGVICTSVGKQAIGWLDGARVLDAN